MHLKDDQIARLADKVLAALSPAGLMTPKVSPAALATAVRSAIAADQKGESDLEKDAAALLEQTLRSMGGGAGIDRHKMLQMIKQRLAKERKIVL